MNILLTTRLPQQGFARLKRHNIIIPQTAFFTEQELLAHAQSCDILVPTFDYKIGKETILSMPNLKLIANFGAGYNNVDIATAKQQGIIVTNTPQPVVEPTAELAFALMISISKRLAELDRKLRTTNDIIFGVMNNLGTSLRGKTLGIIGMGRIGTSLALKAKAFGMNIIYHNRHKVNTDIEKELNAQYVSLEHLLSTADFVSLNLPYTPQVRHLINKETLSLMKSNAILINTARGAIVDEKALIDALQDKRIQAAALDVYEFEPHISEQLLTLDNVLLAPHIGTCTIEGRLDMCDNICDNIEAFIARQPEKMNIVN